jgi:phosphate acetyltransferase
MEMVHSKAKTLNRKICLTESDDPRNLKAAARLVATGYARPVLVGNGATIEKLAREQSIDLRGVEIADICNWPRFSHYV